MSKTKTFDVFARHASLTELIFLFGGAYLLLNTRLYCATNILLLMQLGVNSRILLQNTGSTIKIHITGHFCVRIRPDESNIGGAKVQKA
jgi:hypothetical protein